MIKYYAVCNRTWKGSNQICATASSSTQYRQQMFLANVCEAQLSLDFHKIDKHVLLDQVDVSINSE